MRRRLRGDEGVTTVEFALVLPIFVLLVGIATFFSWIFYTQTQVDRAANRAARYAAVPDTSGNYAYCLSKIRDAVNADLVTGKIDAQHPTDLIVSDGSTVAGVPKGALSETDPCVKPNGFVKVQVSHDFTNPFSYLIAPFTGTTSQLSVTGTGEVRVEAQ